MVEAVANSPSPEFDLEQYQSVIDVLNDSVKRFAGKPAFTNMGHTLTYRDVDQQSRAFAAYIQHHTPLKPGDRIAVQLPNVLQFPVVVFGAMRAGLIVVNTNPLYTQREMEHQFNDAQCKAIVILANMASKLEDILARTAIKTIFITQLADLHPQPKRFLVNSAVKYIKRMVPTYRLPTAIPLRSALLSGQKLGVSEHAVKIDDIAVLQYTGGTTGVAKGAMLTHKNLVANMLQVRHLLTDSIREGQELIVNPLPLYHIYSFTVNCMCMMLSGNHNLLITNPRDIPAFVSELKSYPFTVIVGLNTLFVALLNNPQFRKLDFSSLRLTSSGGMALQEHTAQQWEQLTGCEILEGYGLTETAPVVASNTLQDNKIGTIGKPVLGTEVKLIDDDGKQLEQGATGELCVRGPQVMKGYWQHPEATKEVITDDGWLKTGDMAVIHDDGRIEIVDRKKDVIIVSGFNVYPNEVEDVVVTHPEVLECAAIGVPDETTGEQIRLYVVPRARALDKDELLTFCRQHLTAYKVPKQVEIRKELPKTNVGKILRRELRDSVVS